MGKLQTVVLAGTAAVVLVGLPLRWLMGVEGRRISYGVLMLLISAAGLLAAAAGRRQPTLPADWHRYGVLVSVALAAGGLDGLTGLGAQRIGFSIVTVIGAYAVGVPLWRAFRLDRSSPQDRLDALLVSIASVYLVWWYEFVPAGEAWQEVVLLTFVAVTSGASGLILMSARQLHLSPARWATVVGLALQPLAILVHPSPLQGGRYPDDPLASAITVLGGLVLVAALHRAAAVGPQSSTSPLMHGDVAWWSPMAVVVLTFMTHAGLDRQPAERSPLGPALVVLAGITLVVRIALTVGGLQRATAAAEAERERLRLAVHTDALTGLANRTALLLHLRDALSSASLTMPVSVVFCDLDRLKVVNDSLGHDVGDGLIAAVAGRWGALVQSPALLARLGGDEFVVCTRAAPTDVRRLCEAMHRSLREPVEVDGHRLSTRTSIGIAVAIDPEVQAEALLRDADAAMYRSKAAGGGTTTIFDEAIHTQARRRLDIERHLDDAMADGGADDLIEVHLQPIVDLRTGVVVAVESLVRMTHPTLGPLSPPSVIAVAEETGQIVPLGEVLLDRSCAALRLLRDEGHDVPAVQVNTSASQLTSLGFVTAVHRTLRRHGLPPSALTIEVTEQVLLDTDSPAADTLAVLAEMGVAISMDDFGTGYSSLSYLGRVPIDQLKLDKSFLDTADVDVGHVVVEGVLRIADALGIPTVAEGVETAAHVEDLRHLGCDLGQGYAFSRPLPAEQMAIWLQGRAPTGPRLAVPPLREDPHEAADR